MNNHLLIFTAPPAAGKTHLISQLIDDLDQIPLVISPLRALANECIAKWEESCVVMTPEEWLHKEASHKILIIDEFHLFFYWGDSFRPLMWEAFYGLVENADLVVVLTATLTESMVEDIKKFQCHFASITWADHGNQKLKNKPVKYIKAQSQKWIKNCIFASGNSEGVGLIFCPFRSEVKKWEYELASKGYRVWSCVGGEAGVFSQKVQNEEAPDFIVATTVLSHGVNLPNISRIFFLYQVKNLDFWIQMVARGGRRGEDFEVYSLEGPPGNIGIKFDKFSNFLAIHRISLKMKLHLLLKQIEEWFLKV